MKKMNFKIILVIILASVVLAFAYNYNDISSKGLSYLTAKGPAVSDSLLEVGFSGSNSSKELEGGTISYEQIKARVNNPDFIIIDARSPEDYSKGMIGEAINIFPYGDESEYFEKIYTLERGKKYLIYCTGGNCDLSHHLAEDMKTAGFENIFIYEGGWEEWVTK
ncbi:MAG: rhodanese-like domain-containing protein [Candidatus Kapaibacterium sp.]|nr:rhodanese-like domain-containing protein [Ignavibacteriota bacterium]MCB9221821.1 rhodanese-like domain-containing protein [Ignavibacteria bacterium]